MRFILWMLLVICSPSLAWGANKRDQIEKAFEPLESAAHDPSKVADWKDILYSAAEELSTNTDLYPAFKNRFLTETNNLMRRLLARVFLAHFLREPTDGWRSSQIDTDILVSMYSDPDPDISGLSLLPIRISKDEIYNLLEVKYLFDPPVADVSSRYIALAYLARRVGTLGLPYYLMMLRDANETVRRQAIEALRECRREVYLVPLWESVLKMDTERERNREVFIDLLKLLGMDQVTIQNYDDTDIAKLRHELILALQRQIAELQRFVLGVNKMDEFEEYFATVKLAAGDHSEVLDWKDFIDKMHGEFDFNTELYLAFKNRFLTETNNAIRFRLGQVFQGQFMSQNMAFPRSRKLDTDILVSMCSDPDPKVANLGLPLIRRSEDEVCNLLQVKPLFDVNADPSSKRDALAYLARRVGTLGLPYYLMMLRDANETVRRQAIEALRECRREVYLVPLWESVLKMDTEREGNRDVLIDLLEQVESDHATAPSIDDINVPEMKKKLAIMLEHQIDKLEKVSASKK